jgi:hypothetical protein
MGTQFFIKCNPFSFWCSASKFVISFVMDPNFGAEFSEFIEIRLTSGKHSYGVLLLRIWVDEWFFSHIA